ncbi:Alpha/beta hydrolase family protein [compost metagenome]
MELKIVRTFIPHPGNLSKNIEFFWSEPSGKNKLPVIILIHGHHPTLRLGGRNDLVTGIFEFFADNGMISVSMSQPGYGCSDGPPDYCGPHSQDAVSAIIDYLSTKDFVDTDRIAIHGWSRGANVAAIAASRDPRIKLAVLGAGLYDMLEGYNDLGEGIRKSLSIESDGSKDALTARSPIYHVDNLNVPLLLIHGAKDPVASPIYARKMHEKALVLKKDVTLKMFDQYEHAVPLHTIAELSGEFLVEKGFIKSITTPYRLNHFEPTQGAKK